MIKTIIKLKMLKYALVGGAVAAYAIKKYFDQKKVKSKKDKKPLLISRN